MTKTNHFKEIYGEIIKKPQIELIQKIKTDKTVKISLISFICGKIPFLT